MNTLLIGYDSSIISSETEEAILAVIKSQPSWARLVPNLYGVSTSLSASQMRDQINSVPNRGRILVYEITTSLWATNGMPPEIGKWMQDNWRAS